MIKRYKKLVKMIGGEKHEIYNTMLYRKRQSIFDDV